MEVKVWFNSRVWLPPKFVLIVKAEWRNQGGPRADWPVCESRWRAEEGCFIDSVTISRVVCLLCLSFNMLHAPTGVRRAHEPAVPRWGARDERVTAKRGDLLSGLVWRRPLREVPLGEPSARAYRRLTSSIPSSSNAENLQLRIITCTRMKHTLLRQSLSVGELLLKVWERHVVFVCFYFLSRHLTLLPDLFAPSDLASRPCCPACGQRRQSCMQEHPLMPVIIQPLPIWECSVDMTNIHGSVNSRQDACANYIVKNKQKILKSC